MPSQDRQAIRDEATKWCDLADGTNEILESIRNLNIEESAFWLVDFGTGALHTSYTDLHQTVEGLLSSAEIEFRVFNDTLQETARRYQEIEDNNNADLNAIFRDYAGEAREEHQQEEESSEQQQPDQPQEPQQSH